MNEHSPADVEGRVKVRSIAGPIPPLHHLVLLIIPRLSSHKILVVEKEVCQGYKEREKRA